MSDDFSQMGARLLSQNVEEPRARGVDREQGIAIVARAIGDRARRRQRARVLAYGGALSAAAAVAVVAGFFGARQATSTDPALAACRAAGSCAARAEAIQYGTIDGRRFAPGESLSAPADRSTSVAFGRGTEVALDARSVLEYRQGDSTRRFGLLEGAVHLRVGKLGPGQRFVVETPDAEVEVRGTAFHVALEPLGQGCASPRTRVDVDEGVVEVRFHGQVFRLTPGGHWPAHCDVPSTVVTEVAEVAPATAPPVSAPHAAAVKAAPAPHAKGQAEQKAAEAPAREPEKPTDNASALSEQNNLYGKAVSARRAGRVSEALAAYDQLLSRFPSGALAESARAERLRLLIRAGSSNARTEAARYLARYPRGLASAEARELLGQP
ncbi:MAG: FecR family protein [Polyangiaceae bacterium]